jgi:hypothetical protein
LTHGQSRNGFNSIPVFLDSFIKSRGKYETE